MPFKYMGQCTIASFVPNILSPKNVAKITFSAILPDIPFRHEKNKARMHNLSHLSLQQSDMVYTNNFFKRSDKGSPEKG